MRKAIASITLLMLVTVLPVMAIAQSKAPGQWTNNDLKTALSTAKTPGDHQKIAQYYTAKATRSDADAKEHADLADLYRKAPTLHEQKHPMSPETAAHCQWFADKDKEIAQKYRDMARMHEDMAKPPAQ
jgi:hypothetical protein